MKVQCLGKRCALYAVLFVALSTSLGNAQAEDTTNVGWWNRKWPTVRAAERPSGPPTKEAFPEGTGSPEEIARMVLQKKRLRLIGIDSTKDRGEISFVLARSRFDRQENATTFHFSQLYKGVPIYEVTRVVRVFHDSPYVGVGGECIPIREMDVRPALSENQAVDALSAAIRPDSIKSVELIRLFVYPADAPTLAYLIEARVWVRNIGSAPLQFFVDATTGALRQCSALMTDWDPAQTFGPNRRSVAPNTDSVSGPAPQDK